MSKMVGTREEGGIGFKRWKHANRKLADGWSPVTSSQNGVVFNLATLVVVWAGKRKLVEVDFQAHQN